MNGLNNALFDIRYVELESQSGMASALEFKYEHFIAQKRFVIMLYGFEYFCSSIQRIEYYVA